MSPSSSAVRFALSGQAFSAVPEAGGWTLSHLAEPPAGHPHQIGAAGAFPRAEDAEEGALTHMGLLDNTGNCGCAVAVRLPDGEAVHILPMGAAATACGLPAEHDRIARVRFGAGDWRDAVSCGRCRSGA